MKQLDLFKEEPGPVKVVAVKEEKWYRLLFNKNVIIWRAAYGICAGKKKDMLRTSPGYEHYFKIEPIK